MSEKLQTAVKDRLPAHNAVASNLRAISPPTLLGTRACAQLPASPTGNWIWPRWLRH